MRFLVSLELSPPCADCMVAAVVWFTAVERKEEEEQGFGLGVDVILLRCFFLRLK